MYLKVMPETQNPSDYITLISEIQPPGVVAESVERKHRVREIANSVPRLAQCQNSVTEWVIG